MNNKEINWIQKHYYLFKYKEFLKFDIFFLSKENLVDSLTNRSFIVKLHSGCEMQQLIRANSCSWFKMHLAHPIDCYRDIDPRDPFKVTDSISTWLYHVVVTRQREVEMAWFIVKVIVKDCDVLNNLYLRITINAFHLTLATFMESSCCLLNVKQVNK